MKVEINDIYKDYEQEVLKAIEMMQQEYPVLNEIIKIIHLEKMDKRFRQCFASSKIIYSSKIEFEIKLNPEAFCKPNINFKFLSTRPTAYYFTVKDIIVHELAHALQIFYLCSQMNIDITKYKYFWRIKHRKIISPKAAVYFKTYFKQFFYKYQWTDNMIESYLGSYAFNNPMELLPECFNNYYHLKDIYPNFSDEEKKIYELTQNIIEDYKKYIPNSIFKEET